MVSIPARLQAPGSRRIVLSYVLDWIVIILIAVVAGAITYTHPNRRPFSLVDPEISFPYVAKEKVSVGTLFAISLAVPAVLIVLISILLVPSPKSSSQSSRSHLWQRKIWEWNAGWLGLALSMTVTVFLVNGLKLLLGKPRPDLLARCDPDLANAAAYVLGGVNDRISEGTLVSWTICRNTDTKVLEDGFQAFPSGHAGTSFAGLIYFALYLCAKFAVRIPYLLPYTFGSAHRHASATPTNGHVSEGSKGLEDPTAPNATLSESRDPGLEFRDQAAAPPVYTIILPLIPLSLALYITSTRYSDFRHHGFDLLGGALIGTVVAWLSFRLYHLPVRRGAGWAWGSRSATRAFGARIGTLDYVESNEQRAAPGGIEAGNGHAMSGPAMSAAGH